MDDEPRERTRGRSQVNKFVEVLVSRRPGYLKAFEVCGANKTKGERLNVQRFQQS